MAGIIMLIGCVVIGFLTIVTCLIANNSLNEQPVADTTQKEFVKSHMQKGGNSVKTQKVHRK